MMYKVETVEREQVFFEDIEVGSEIPTITRGPYTAIKTALFIGALWVDFFPAHYCGAWARRMGCPGIYVHSHLITPLLGQLVTDWMGPNGTLKKFTCQIRGDTYARFPSELLPDTYEGDTLTVKGRVIKKYTKDSENYVECEVWGEKQDRTVVIQGSATVILPSHSIGSSLMRS